MALPRLLPLLAIGFLSILLQGTVFRSLTEFLFLPNLIVIVVVFLAFYEVSLGGVLASFLLGLLFDLASASLVGPWAGSCVAVYGVLSGLSQRIFVESPFAIFLAVSLSSLACSLLYVLLTFQFRPVHSSIFLYALTEGLVTGIFSFIMFPLLKSLLLSRGRLRTRSLRA